MRLLLHLVLVFLLVSTTASVAAACPTCKDGLDNPAQHALARGYFYSTFGSFAYLSIRRAQAEQALALRQSSASGPPREFPLD